MEKERQSRSACKGVQRERERERGLTNMKSNQIKYGQRRGENVEVKYSERQISFKFLQVL